jgi:hypothetical protein
MCINESYVHMKFTDISNISDYSLKRSSRMPIFSCTVIKNKTPGISFPVVMTVTFCNRKMTVFNAAYKTVIYLESPRIYMLIHALSDIFNAVFELMCVSLCHVGNVSLRRATCCRFNSFTTIDSCTFSKSR